MQASTSDTSNNVTPAGPLRTMLTYSLDGSTMEGCRVATNPTPRTMYLAPMELLEQFAVNGKNNNNSNNHNKLYYYC